MLKRNMETYHVFNFLCCISIVLGAHLPSNLKVCKISSPDFGTCLTEGLQDALPKLVNGIPELGLPSVDPLIPRHLSIKRAPGPISLDQEYTNTKISGLSKSKVVSFKVDIKNKCNLIFETITPDLQVNGHYVLKGQMLLFPIDAEGDFAIKFKNAYMLNNCECERYTKDGADYIKLTSSKIEFKADTISFDLGTIIKGNKQIDDDVHKIIDGDSVAFFEIMKPAALAMLQQLGVEVSNNIFSQVPVNEIFND